MDDSWVFPLLIEDNIACALSPLEYLIPLWFYLSESDWLLVDDVCVYAYLTSKVLRTMLSHDLTDYNVFPILKQWNLGDKVMAQYNGLWYDATVYRFPPNKDIMTVKVSITDSRFSSTQPSQLVSRFGILNHTKSDLVPSRLSKEQLFRRKEVPSQKYQA